MISRLLKVEHSDEPTEIVIHVNMLKEGWDVTNLYTIIPLRAAHARTLIEQSIGRGLRLPYGKRTDVAAVDRLSIVAHDRFQEIVDEANRPDSQIHLKAIVLDSGELDQKTRTVVSQSQLATKLGIVPAQTTSTTTVAGADIAPTFTKPDEQRVAQIAYTVIKSLENQPVKAPSLAALSKPAIQAEIVKAVQEQFRPAQLELEGIAEQPDIASVVARTTELVQQQTIDIPRIQVVPTGVVKSGFRPFDLKLETLRYPAPSEELWSQYLRTGERRCFRSASEASKRSGWRIMSSAASLTSTTSPTMTMPTSSTNLLHRPSSTSRAICQRRNGKSSAVSSTRDRQVHSLTDAGAFLGGSGRLRNEDQQGVHGAEAERLHGVSQRLCFGFSLFASRQEQYGEVSVWRV